MLKLYKFFLPNGNPRGVKIAEVTNRTVQAILIPRNELNDAKSREEITNVAYTFYLVRMKKKQSPKYI